MSLFRSLITRGWQHASTVIFLVGFITDSWLLPEVENPVTKYIGLAYLVVLAMIIFLREWIVSFNTASRTEQRLFSLLTFGVSFFSGAALSFIFVYAMRSAALAVSWPLFVILIICMIANEFISSHHYRFTLDIAVFYIAMVFYAIFNVPLLFASVNDKVFLVAVAISAIIGLVYMYVLKHSSEAAYYERGRGYALAMGIPMFVGMLYFLNVIPAVPLSLRDAGIYHKVERLDSGEYRGVREIDKRFLSEYRRPTFHMTNQDTGVYFFSSISAPGEFIAPITHVWEHYDERNKKWISKTMVSFNLSGGRDGGYRAYSMKENVEEGMWRITVKVDDNRIVGRLRFYIIKGTSALVEDVKL